jgi:hypothetical protein
MTVATEVWKEWVVCPRSGFEVFGTTASDTVPLAQVTAKNFTVGARFRISNTTVQDRVVEHLRKVGAFDDDEERLQAYRTAADYHPSEGTTDLASIPWFMRWYVNTYGQHTLAAIIHDQLIADQPNAGTLRSDVVSDHFFREMLEACGTPYFKRWVMWTAVAMRTRWAAGGWKRFKLLLWGAASIVGMGGTIWLLVAGHFLAALGFGVALLLVSAVLWGRQWGAAIVAAIALPLIAPATVLVLIVAVLLLVLDKVT